MQNNIEEYNKDYFVGGTKSHYDDYKNCEQVVRRLYKLVVEAIGVTPDIYLDAGCAYGYALLEALETAREAYGFDVSEHAVDMASDIIDGQRYTCSIWQQEAQDPTGISIRTGSIDLVTAFELLEHIPAEDIKQAVKNLWATVKKGGHLVLMPNTGEEDDHDKTHISVFPREWWEKFFEEIGLKFLLYRDIAAEKKFNQDDYAKEMKWSGRIFIFKKI